MKRAIPSARRFRHVHQSPSDRQEDPGVDEAVRERGREEAAGSPTPSPACRRPRATSSRSRSGSRGTETARGGRVAPVHHRVRRRRDRQVEVRKEADDERADGDAEVAERDPQHSGSPRQQHPSPPGEDDEGRHEQDDRLLVAEREPEQEREEPQEPDAIGPPAPLDPDEAGAPPRRGCSGRRPRPRPSRPRTGSRRRAEARPRSPRRRASSASVAASRRSETSR